MIKTVIQENSYQDSINLMLLTDSISQIEGVTKVQVMMGTAANKDIFETAGLLTAEAKEAKANDMVIVLEVMEEQTVKIALTAISEFLKDLSTKKKKTQTTEVTSWEQALDTLPEANIALISVPGMYAADEIENALDHGLHAFVFSDNVAVADEVRLKKKAHEKGLLVMGPDCGTGIINSIPLAFTNVVRSGNIGVVGASGTGIQEVTTLIHRHGGGVLHAIGTGGHDLSEEVGGITMKDTLVALDQQDDLDVLVVISKPPGKTVRDQIVKMLHSLSKPVVAIFVGEKPKNHHGDVYFAHTLEETAQLAVTLSKGEVVPPIYHQEPKHLAKETIETKKLNGFYSGGTLAYEAAMLISETLNLADTEHEAGYMLKTNEAEIIDLGDDRYTQGKPHPMIDPETRIGKIREAAQEENTGIILFDVVLGYGAHDDMAGSLAPVIEESLELAKSQGRSLRFIATICGTDLDPQVYGKAYDTLEKIGVLLEESNTRAVKLALSYLGKEVTEEPKEILPYTAAKEELPMPREGVLKLLTEKPQIINIGLASFDGAIKEVDGESLHYQWKPAAGGDLKLMKIIRQIRQNQEITEKNQEVIGRLKNATPFLTDVVPAKSVISELNGRVLLHAGPPISYEEMTGPMQGSCIGAALFEGWANDEAEAVRQLAAGEIKFIPCHHVKAVGPMGGITSANMPVLVVKNQLTNNEAYCTLNEGIGKVLRFGAYSEEVVTRLTWMKNVLGPTISTALKQSAEGINLNSLIAKAITMGDEFHQRNIAASLLFLKELTPLILKSPIEEKQKISVIQFLADTDQFFLNIMMATGKAMVDGARKVEAGTIVTTMTRNGKDFGIRISGLGDQWFTAPVNTPEGLFFTGFSQEDANPDIGDSAITETVGVGAMSMIAAPGVTRFVGAGGFQEALNVSNQMSEICETHNANFSIPTWDFQGAPLGIDICKVVEKGITPLINTGIAHKKAGVGQVGAGTVRAPLACFEKALLAYGESLGIVGDE